MNQVATDHGDPGEGSETWNRQVDALDVEGLANQLASTGAKYLLFTIGQNSGHYCAPNAVHWRI